MGLQVLYVNDLSRAVRHYEVLFGCMPDTFRTADRAEWHLDDAQAVTVTEAPSHVGEEIATVIDPDLRGCLHRLTAAGIRHSIVTIGDVSIATVEDGDGNLVVLFDRWIDSGSRSA